MSVGSQLQQARQDRKLSFSDVTKETKIQPWVLEALEADRLQDMMSPIYVKGFLTTYAKFLHVDPEPLMGQVRWPQPEATQEELPPPPPPRAPIRLSLPRPLLRGLGITAAVAVAFALVVSQPRQQVGRQGARPRPPAARQAKKAAPTREAAKPPTPKVGSPAPATEASPSQPVTPQLASVSVMSDPIKPVPPPTLTLLTTQPLELSVTADRTTWVRVRADGKLLSQQRLPRGAHERWIAKKQIEVVISKPSEVEVTLNGQSITPFAIAHRGRLLITHHGITQLPDDEE